MNDTGTIFNMTPTGAVASSPAKVQLCVEVEECNRLGQRYYLAGDFARAEECFLAIIRADPQHADGWGNLGVVWQHAGALEDAIKCMMNSHALDPRNAENLTNLGYINDELGFLDHAARLFSAALELKPGEPRATCNLGYTYLKQLRFKEAWPLVEARFHTVPPMAKMREYAHMPLWDGGRCNKLAIWSEQGIGDQILYGTLLPELIGRGQDFVCELDARLLPAFRRSFPTFGTLFQSPPCDFKDCDAHVPIQSLARFYRSGIEDFAAQSKRLLTANAALGATEWLADPALKNIAISWHSFLPPSHVMQERRKSAPLEAFSLLGQRDDVQLVSVQYGGEALPHDFDQWDSTANNPIHIPNIDLRDDIEGVLAVIAACDVVVTTSNVTVHLAGALGKKTYLIQVGTPVLFYHATQPQSSRHLWYPSVTVVTDTTWHGAIRQVNEML